MKITPANQGALQPGGRKKLLKLKMVELQGYDDCVTGESRLFASLNGFFLFRHGSAELEEKNRVARGLGVQEG